MKTCLFHIHNLGLTAKLNARAVDLHRPSFVSSILYKSAFMDIMAILLKALGLGIRVL